MQDRTIPPLTSADVKLVDPQLRTSAPQILRQPISKKRIRPTIAKERFGDGETHGKQFGELTRLE